MTVEEITLEMIKEVSTEIDNMHTKVDNNHIALMKEISVNREEFIIFKTKVNSKTAMISTIIGLAIALGGLGIQYRKMNKEIKTQEPTEQVIYKTS